MSAILIFPLVFAAIGCSTELDCKPCRGVKLKYGYIRLPALDLGVALYQMKKLSQ